PRGDDADRGEDRIDETVQPLDLVHRGVVPGLALRTAVRIARLPSVERWVVGEEVGVPRADRQRVRQLMGDERDQLRAGFVDLAELLQALLRLGLLAPFLDDPR